MLRARAFNLCWQTTTFIPMIFLSALAVAQRPTTSAGAELLLSDEHYNQIVVTASRMAMRSGDAPSAVTVFTEKDIRAMGALTVLDVLRYAPGLDVFQMNHADTNVSARSFNALNANKLLIMVDGRTIYQDSTGSILWTTLNVPIIRIKRIEIVRGPGSALYGANAFSGVINIITKAPRELASAPSKTTLRSAIGDYGTTYNEFLTSTPTTSGWYFTTGGVYNKTDGFGSRKANRVRDSYTMPVITLDAEKRFKRGSVIVSLGQTDGQSDYNQSGTASLLDVHAHTGYMLIRYDESRVKNPISGHLFSNFFLSSLASGNTRPLKPGGALHLTDETTFDAELQQQRTLSSHHNIVYGANYRSTLLRSQVTAGGKHQRELYAVYFQDDIRLGRRTHLFAGFRLDDNSQYGLNFTPRLSLLHRVSSSETVRLSFGSAFRSPTLLESYEDLALLIAPGLNLRVRGRRDLKPERVTSYEVGWHKVLRNGSLGVNAFYNQYTDLISPKVTALAPSPPFPAGIPTELTFFNQRGARIVGVELEGQMRINSRLRGLFNYAYQDAVKDGGKSVDLSPHHKVNFGLAAQLNSRWDAYAGVHYVDSVSFDTGSTVLKLAPYARVDGKLSYRFGTEAHPLSFSVVVNDLFDSRHLEFPDLTPGSSNPQVAPQRRSVYLVFEGKF